MSGETPMPEEPIERLKQRVQELEATEQQPNFWVRDIPGTNIEVEVSDPNRDGATEIHLWENHEGQRRLVRGIGIDLPERQEGMAITAEQANRVFSLFESARQIGAAPEEALTFMAEVNHKRFLERIAKKRKESP